MGIIITIIVICLVVFGFKQIVPFLWSIIRGIYHIVTLPLAMIGGFLGFIIEAVLFIGLLWLAVLIIG